MKKNLKVTVGVMTGVLSLGSTGMNVYAAAPTAGVSDYTSTVMTSGFAPSAGLSSVMNDCLQQTESNAIIASAQPEIKKTEKQKVKSKYADIAVAQVNNFVYIRKKADEDSEYVGKLYSDCVGTVLKKKGDWYKIKSGNVTGYVSADYVKVGDEKLVKSVGRRLATVEAETLKVREDTSKKSSVLGLVSAEDDLTVIDESEKGWVGVSIEEGTGYVSSDYVKLTTEYSYAESREEEEERLLKEEEERQVAAEAAAEAAEVEEDDDRAEETTTTKSTTKSSTKSTKSSSTKSSSTTSSEKSSSTKSSGKSSTKKSSTKKSDSSKSSSEDETEEKTSKASGSGQAVADYACQFVGNPYVYGGSSLTNGTDCSGFVMSVYKHFGISLPHSSSALRSVGYGVSKSDMQPGDIVCYSGHVGIYIGGNTIVHASNRRDGIKYTSPANYRTILAVRRIF